MISLYFKEMKRQGTGGALLFDAGDGAPDLPHGSAFMSDEWRELQVFYGNKLIK